MKRSILAMAVLALFAATAAPARPTLSRSPADATYIVEFTILQPFLVETVTCQSWAALVDLTGAAPYGVFSGAKCKPTGPIPDRSGTHGGNVSATFDTLGGTITLDSCRLQSVNASGAAPDVVLTYAIDCD